MSNTEKNVQKEKWFNFLYRTRVMVQKDDTVIFNLSIIFVIFALLSAPWVALVFFIASLALGYRFSVSRNAKAFSSDLDSLVQNAAQNMKDAAQNVKDAVDSVVKNEEE